MYGLYGDMPMHKVMYGQNAMHVPMNFIFQSTGDGGKVIGMLQTSDGIPLMCGSPRTHILLLGDVVIRPHLILASDNFRGGGLSGLAKSGFIDQDKWLGENCDVILGPQTDVAQTFMMR